MDDLSKDELHLDVAIADYVHKIGLLRERKTELRRQYQAKNLGYSAAAKSQEGKTNIKDRLTPFANKKLSDEEEEEKRPLIHYVPTRREEEEEKEDALDFSMPKVKKYKKTRPPSPPDV